MDLSIVIPAYNEEQRLGPTLAAIARYFSHSQRETEVIVVDDGSNDGSARLLERPPGEAPNVRWRILHNPGNRGKGYSVRHGMLAATGKRRLFTDADLSAPIEELERLDRALDEGHDIAIGSRRREMIRQHQSWVRENSGRLFNRIVRLGLDLQFVDTQCGFKLFTGESTEAIFAQQTIEGWGFDPELLYLARLGGFTVAEVPVVWAHAEGAKIHMLRDSARMFADVVSIRRNHRRGVYSGLARHTTTVLAEHRPSGAA